MKNRQTGRENKTPCQNGIMPKKKSRAARAKNRVMQSNGIETNHPIRWNSKTTRIDIDTGELITEHKAKMNYIHIKTEKNVTLNFNKTAGTIEYTKQYRKQPQLKLFE